MSYKNNQDETKYRVVGPDPDRMEFPWSQVGIFSVPAPLQALSFDSLSGGYGPSVRHMFRTQSGLPLSTNSTSQRRAVHVNLSDSETLDSQQNLQTHDQSGESKQQSEESREDPRNILLTTDQSGGTNLHSGTPSQSNFGGCGTDSIGSNRNATAAAVAYVTTESRYQEGILALDRIRMIDYQHSSHREAALTKFRMKRKDRCYEKKVPIIGIIITT